MKYQLLLSTQYVRSTYRVVFRGINIPVTIDMEYSCPYELKDVRPRHKYFLQHQCGINSGIEKDRQRSMLSNVQIAGVHVYTLYFQSLVIIGVDGSSLKMHHTSAEYGL